MDRSEDCGGVEVEIGERLIERRDGLVDEFAQLRDGRVELLGGCQE